MLKVSELCVSYGAVEATKDITLTAPEGSTTAILGANGAGKSSLLRAISGVAPVVSGDIVVGGVSVVSLSAERRARMGLSHAMEGRRIFKQLTVEENLELAWSFGARTPNFATARATIYERFPILEEKAGVRTGLLSGGQQQMAILSCATIRSPRYLLLDEPSLGLAPIIVTQIYGFISAYARESGTTVIIAEQMASMALRVTDFGHVLRNGRMVLSGESKDLLARGGESLLSSTYL